MGNGNEIYVHIHMKFIIGKKRKLIDFFNKFFLPIVYLKASLFRFYVPSVSILFLFRIYIYIKAMYRIRRIEFNFVQIESFFFNLLKCFHFSMWVCSVIVFV